MNTIITSIPVAEEVPIY